MLSKSCIYDALGSKEDSIFFPNPNISNIESESKDMPNPNISYIESESKDMTKLILLKYKCDQCMFEAKSVRGLKTHIGHMHKDKDLSGHALVGFENKEAPTDSNQIPMKTKEIIIRNKVTVTASPMSSIKNEKYSLLFYKRITIEFSTKKQKTDSGQEYVNCNICGKYFTEGRKLVDHAMITHNGKEIIEKKFNMIWSDRN